MANELSDIRLVIEVVANAGPLNSVATAMDRVNTSMAKGSQMQSRGIQTLQGASRGWARFSEKLKGAEQKMDAVFRAGVHLQAMGRDLTGAGMALFNFAGDIVGRYAKYDFVLRQTAVALNTNTEWQHKLDKAIQATAITLGKYKPEEVAEAYRLWGAATGDVVDSQQSLARITSTVEKILIATGMAGGTVESNIKGIYGVLKQYNLDMSKAGMVTEVLSVLTERTAANFGDLTGAFVYTGSAIGNLGGTFEDTAQVLGILADAGYRGTKAGRGLSMVFEAFLSPTTVKAKRALNALAKAASNGTKNWEDLITPIKNGKRHFIGIRETVTKLAKAMKDMGPIERQQAINAIFTNNAARAMLPTINAQIHLWEEQARAGKKLTSVFDEQKYSLATASDFFKNMTDQFRGSIDSLVGAFHNSLFPILQMLSGEIMKIAGPILKTLTNKFQELTAFLEANPALVEIAVKFGAIAAIILVVVGSFITLLGTIALFMSNIFLVGAALLPLVGIVLAIIAAVGALGVAFANNTRGLRDAVTNLATAIGTLWDRLTGGESGRTQWITDLTTSLSALATIVLDNVVAGIKSLTEWLNGLTDEQVTIIRQIVEWLAKLVALAAGMKILGAVVGILSGALFGFTKFLLTLGGTLPILVRGILAMHGAFEALLVLLRVAPALAGPIGWVIMAIIAAIAAFVIAYQTNFMGFRDFIDGIVVWITTNVVPILQAAWQALSDSIGAVIAAISAVINDVLVPAFDAVVNWMVEIFGPVVDGFLQMLASIGDFFSVVADAVMGALGRIGDAVRAFFDFFGGAQDESKKTTDDWGTTIQAILNGLGDFINTVVLPVFGGFMTFVKGVFESIASIIRGAFSIVTGIFKVATGILTGDWQMFWNGLNSILRGWWGILEGLIRGMLGAFESVIRIGLGVIDGIFKMLFGDGAGSIYGSIKGVIQTFAKLGGDIIQGLVKGVGDTIQWALGKIGGFINDIVGGIKSVLGIKSPSTVLAGIGKNIVQGLWSGIVGLKDWIINKLMGFIKNVIPGPIKDVLGISSPSRVMMGFGANIVEGLALGIAKTDDAYRAMTLLSNDLVAMASDASTGISLAGTASLASTVTRDNTKTINLNVDVTSGDGSVNDVDLSTLSELITGSSMVRALERMSTAD